MTEVTPWQGLERLTGFGQNGFRDKHIVYHQKASALLYRQDITVSNWTVYEVLRIF